MRVVAVPVQVMDNGLLCHQAVEQLNPILKAEATVANAPGALQWLNSNGDDLLEKPSMWIIVSTNSARPASSRVCYTGIFVALCFLLSGRGLLLTWSIHVALLSLLH